MKINLLSGILFFPFICNAQVGIGTPSPAATLDVTAKDATGTTTNVDGILIPRVDRQRAQSMTGVPTSTLVYVNSVATGAQTGTAVNIDAVGYYYYNGSLWTKLNAPVNIYNSDGTITGNRIATTAGNSLTFVNGANNVIIGTAGTQGIVSTTGSSRGAFQANGGAGVLNMFVDNGSSAQITTSGNSTSMNLNTIAANPINILTNNTNRMTVTGTGSVGVATQTPQKNLHVNGSLQVVNELNVGGNATTAGSAGTTGQILTSSGAGVAPTWKTLNTSSGTISSANYVQGTTALTITQGTVADVPGVTITLTVPAGMTQTFLFNILGYAPSLTSSDSQGAFYLLQNGVKISSAYTSMVSGTQLVRLPIPVTFLKAVTLTAGTYTFKVQYSSWFGDQTVNYVPSGYSGYNGDTEAMLTKMQVLVYNN
ncbi:hypothetical protein NZD88_00610 [Chryseobacterium antibioticum]|uniref:C1q domain-containing protein n=1 Tax=Chryseobacterium pyrolae TaxID=2987481 RepID=A0ABT2IBQ7_9FLAO|nr:hypothetical protein [Chryseobacterium pyrolae]MCT2406052.1 hypothetical protein [Chryseobacterium pyrolae]